MGEDVLGSGSVIILGTAPKELPSTIEKNNENG
jgi:hypothetical protein